MRVLVTRAEGDADVTAERLHAMGHEAVLAPLLQIRFLAGPAIDLDGVQAILATSANGVRALSRRISVGNMQLFAVGARTAETAREAGFAQVEHAAGDAAALADLVAARLKPVSGQLLHACGVETRGALAGRLASKGFAVRTEVVYEAVGAEHLPHAAREALVEGRLDAALFYSPRTAKIFADAVLRSGLGDACRRLVALSISAAAADALAPLTFREIRVAARPDRNAVLQLLG